MSRAATLLSSLLLGLLVGAATVALPQDRPRPPRTADRAGGPHAPRPGSAAPPAAAAVPAPAGDLLLVWTAGGLPEGFADRVRNLPGVASAVEVRGDVADLHASTAGDGTPVDRPAGGWAIPLDAITADPAAFGAHVSRPADIGTLQPGQAVLGATAASLRNLGTGASLTLATNVTVTVAAVVDDVTVGGAEVLLHPSDAPAAAVTTPRYVLLHHRGGRAQIETALRSVAGSRSVRVRAPGETPYLRHGDAVLPQARIKAAFGEFAYRPAGDVAVAIEPEWVAEHIRTGSVPILGTVTCHRAILPTLRQAFGQLAADGLAHLIDPDQYAGCFSARRIAPGQALSRHAWGVAVDLNRSANPTGRGSRQDPRLVARLADAGFTWGGTWLVPDPMHFEYVQPPALAPPKVPG